MPTKTKTKGGPSHAKAVSVQAHQPKTSKTLMRKSVKKPAPGLKRQVKAVDSVKHKPTANKTALAPKASQLRVGKVRVGDVNKSPLVKHFSDVTPRTLAMQKPGVIIEPTVVADLSPYKPKTKPVAMGKPKTTNDLLELALNKAVSHEEAHVSLRKRSRIMVVWFVSIVVLAIIVLVVSERIANVRVQVAAHNAGFTSNLPKDLPVGYSLSKVTHANGVVTAVFKDNSEPGQTYSLVQHSSSWNSASLRANYVNAVDPGAITMQDNNQTVYLYGDEDATWVSNGIWYVVNSNGSLSNQQLLNLAGSS